MHKTNTMFAAADRVLAQRSVYSAATGTRDEQEADVLGDAHRQPIAVYLPSLTGGGSQINALRLAEWLVADGHSVDLVVHDRSGHVAERVPRGVRVVELQPASEPWTRLHMLWAARDDAGLFVASMFRSRRQLDRLLYLPSLCTYLRQHRPALVISNLWQLAINLITARAAVAPRMPVVCIFRSAYFTQCAEYRAHARRDRKWRRFFDYCRRIYNRADALVTVSRGVACDLIDILGVDPGRVQVIHNPSASPEIFEQAQAPLDHPWFAPDRPPVILAVGRLSPEKRFDDLIDAFARLRALSITARLFIIGDGDERSALMARAEASGYAEDIALPGWDDNPYAYMQRCGVFVLCSKTEGLPTALIESMACGAPVVAYDCPHGPAEILDHGRYGRLVPAGDVAALSRAMADTLARPGDRETRIQRALVFSPENSARSYRGLLDRLLGERSGG